MYYVNGPTTSHELLCNVSSMKLWPSGRGIGVVTKLACPGKAFFCIIPPVEKLINHS